MNTNVKLAIAIYAGDIVINFSQKTDKLIFAPAEAVMFARLILDKAETQLRHEKKNDRYDQTTMGSDDMGIG